jgi:hypothetical protein
MAGQRWLVGFAALRFGTQMKSHRRRRRPRMRLGHVLIYHSCGLCTSVTDFTIEIESVDTVRAESAGKDRSAAFRFVYLVCHSSILVFSMRTILKPKERIVGLKDICICVQYRTAKEATACA